MHNMEFVVSGLHTTTQFPSWLPGNVREMQVLHLKRSLNRVLNASVLLLNILFFDKINTC